MGSPTYSLTAPPTGQAGEPTTGVVMEICCNDPNGCPDSGRITAELQVEGSTIHFNDSISFGNDFCRDVEPRPEQYLDDTLPSGITTDWGEIVFEEPGEYTISASGSSSGSSFSDSQTITITQPFDASLVDSSCSITAPDTVTPGDTVTLTATISNGNSDSGDVEVTFSFGSATETVQTTAPANGSAEATAEFVPEEPGEFTPSVDHTVL